MKRSIQKMRSIKDKKRMVRKLAAKEDDGEEGRMNIR
jgi:hypothetical protein